MKRLLLSLIVLALALPARAADKDPLKNDLPVTAKLTAKKDSYKLDLGGKTAEEFTKALKERRGAKPKPTAVDLVLEITNTSDKDIELWTSGEPMRVSLDLKGPGAESIYRPRRPGLIIESVGGPQRGPQTATLRAGGSHQIPIGELSHNKGGAAMISYWTEPGEYTLSATFNTAIKPAPKGSYEAADGFGLLGVTSNVVKITVEK